MLFTLGFKLSACKGADLVGVVPPEKDGGKVPAQAGGLSEAVWRLSEKGLRVGQFWIGDDPWDHFGGDGIARGLLFLAEAGQSGGAQRCQDRRDCGDAASAFGAVEEVGTLAAFGSIHGLRFGGVQGTAQGMWLGAG